VSKRTLLLHLQVFIPFSRYMARPKSRKSLPSGPTPFEEARDELFQQIMQCGVVGADAEHQHEWFDDTMKYFAERYPELGDGQVKELRKLGERFAQPPKARASA
jgi:hypothetical protein